MENDVLQRNEYNGEVYKSRESDSAVNHSGDTPMVNGYSNGIEEKMKKSEHKDKDRDKYKDKHRDKEKDKDRHKDRDKDRDKHRDRDHKSSSSHKSKDRSDKEKDKHRDKDRERDREKEREKDGKSRDKEKDKEHKSSSSSHKDKDRERSDKDKSKHSSSKYDKEKHKSSKEKERSDKEKSDKEKSDKEKSDRDKEKRDKDKHKDKSSTSSSKDKEKQKEKDREREKDRDREKNKEREKDKEREKEKKHSSSSKDKDRRRDEKRDSGEKLKISFPDAGKDSVKRKVLRDSEDDDDDEKPLTIDESGFNDSVQPVEESVDDITIKSEPEDSFISQEETTMDESRVKTEPEDSEEDMPLSVHAARIKREISDDEEDEPLARKKIKKEKSKKRKKESDYDDEEEDFKPKKKKSAPKKSVKVEKETSVKTSLSPTKKKKEEEEQEVWKWWEEEKKPDGVKWTFLEHKGPVFPPPYEPLPRNVKFYYDGKEVALSTDAEEVATFYAKMLEHDYVTKDVFNKNFFKDWRKVMTSEERELITDLKKCNFKPMHAYFVQKSEERKAMTKEEKKAIKEKNDELIEEYGFCKIDGHKEKIGNFRLEPPGLFRGRGEHPKMGMLKKRLYPEDISINCSKDSVIPKPPDGHKWKEVKHDPQVTWLASWIENVQGQGKYIMLNPSSKLKGEKDWQKYETARRLAKSIDKIRKEYREDWKSKEMRIRQRAVALYFIDILALRAGNEKDEDQADTVGCCSLRVEHIQLFPEKDGKEFVVVFDFLGKDSIRYYNEVPVEKRVFKNLQLFMEGKKPNDDLFDRLNTQILNKHLNELMEGLTAKVFRTYNASWTLQQQLKELTNPEYSLPEMILAYNRANRAVAILCNHQRSVPKSHQKSMDNLKEKIASKKEAIEEAEKQYKFAKRDAKNGSAKEKIVCDKAKKKLERLKEQLTKLEVMETDREENKTIALGTSKLNYLDPRISVAWCKKYNVPIDKIYNKTQRMKFRWAIDMATADYEF